jgi:hypothetical protein
MFSIFSKKYNLLQQEKFRKYLFESQEKSIALKKETLIKRRNNLENNLENHLENHLGNSIDNHLNNKNYFHVLNDSVALNKCNFDITFLFLALVSSFGFFFIYRLKN